MANKLDLIKDFNKIWTKKEVENDVIPPGEYVGYMDPANVMMIIPKLRSIKSMIVDNFDVKEDKVPKLNYTFQFINSSEDKLRIFGRLTGEKNEIAENSVKLSPEYMVVILKLCTKTKSGGILFKYRKDYPLWAETEEMIIILAPRVDGV